MKHNVLIYLVFFLLVACSGIPDLKSIESALAKERSLFFEAVKSGDIDKALDGVTDDMIFLSDPGAMEKVEGKKAYRSLMETGFKYVSFLDIRSEVAETTVIDEYSAIQTGTWRESILIKASSDTLNMWGAFMAFSKKGEDGRWRIHRIIRNRHDSNTID